MLQTPKKFNAYRRPDASFNTTRVYKASTIGDGSPGFRRDSPRPKLGPRLTPTKQGNPSRLKRAEVITVEDDSTSEAGDEEIIVLESMPALQANAGEVMDVDEEACASGTPDVSDGSGSEETESDEEEPENEGDLEQVAAMARKREPKLDDDDDDEPLWMHEPGRGWVCII